MIGCFIIPFLAGPDEKGKFMLFCKTYEWRFKFYSKQSGDLNFELNAKWRFRFNLKAKW